MNQAGYTPPGGSYPPYLSIGIEGDEVTVTVRSPPVTEGASILTVGVTATMTLPLEEFRKLLKGLDGLL